jgi:hypothetical protein
MKKMIFMVSALLITGALISGAFAQEAQPAKQQAVPAAPAASAVTPAAPAKKKTPKKKIAKEAPAPVTVAVVPPFPQVEAATAAPVAASVPVAVSTPVAVSVPVKAEPPARPPACPGCFQPLLAGYIDIIADLKPWMEEMDVQASDLDSRLSEIQKRINEKEDAIEKAKLGTNKKEAKAAVKSLGKERKTILKEYTDTRDKKDKFYKTFSKEVEKKMEGYNKITAMKLQMTLSAASQ